MPGSRRAIAAAAPALAHAAERHVWMECTGLLREAFERACLLDGGYQIRELGCGESDPDHTRPCGARKTADTRHRQRERTGRNGDRQQTIGERSQTSRSDVAEKL